MNLADTCVPVANPTGITVNGIMEKMKMPAVRGLVGRLGGQDIGFGLLWG